MDATKADKINDLYDDIVAQLRAHQNILDNSTCSDICDATHEIDGCMGACALKEGRRRVRNLLESLTGTPSDPATIDEHL